MKIISKKENHLHLNSVFVQKEYAFPMEQTQGITAL